MSSSHEPGPRRRGRGRPRGGGGPQTRERILAAAADVFAENGYRATTMLAVSEAARLSQTGLAHHFPDKELLLAAVLDRRDRLDAEALGPFTGRGWDGFDRLLRLVEHNTGQPSIVRLFAALEAEAVDTSHPAHPWLVEHHQRVVERVRVSLAEAVADGEARPEVPVGRVARLTIAVMDGLQVQWLMDPEGVDMAGDFAAYLAALKSRWAVPASP
ncbi:MAG TPA: TetR/AcrR family transcriptional regulator [Marmoricola sp.]|nr:TetR/AcrR family transcriptional regulator [Marmoricola sp.]